MNNREKQREDELSGLPDDIERWEDNDELFCTECGAPESECTCPASDPLDDMEANTQGDIGL